MKFSTYRCNSTIQSSFRPRNTSESTNSCHYNVSTSTKTPSWRSYRVRGIQVSRPTWSTAPVTRRCSARGRDITSGWSAEAWRRRARTQNAVRRRRSYEEVYPRESGCSIDCPYSFVTTTTAVLWYSSTDASSNIRARVLLTRASFPGKKTKKRSRNSFSRHGISVRNSILYAMWLRLHSWG